jgi:hypothetical protein
MKRSLATGVCLLVFAVMLSGCFPASGYATQEDPAGFFLGVWHGWIAPLSLIVSIFDDDVRIYEPNNAGWFYDFGFYIAIIAGFGSISIFRRDDRNT